MSKKWIIRTVVAAVLVLAALVTLSACGGDDDNGGDNGGTSVTGVAEITERFQGRDKNASFGIAIGWSVKWAALHVKSG